MKRFFLLIWSLIIGGMLVAPMGVSLAASKPSPSSSSQTTCAQDAAGNCNLNLTTPQKCIQVALPIFATAKSGGCPAGQVSNDPAQGGAIIIYLREVLQLMSSAVGIVIVLMLVIAGIQYITSTGNSSLVGAAKKRIVNAVTALLLFMFMVVILQFIVPGGIL